ncbi:hypothetical protein [Flavisolibacter ginsenosidimutans]|uniref:DUF4369 domain-containing protein n=1 Tax=Flavisolibacter ginsenosidimutans TaxID=661481 RepID=A0A5B8UGU5_9BACT|nr:hypothetical protein [Flavisolibacter ginsenosidimutans]QEC55575.1 hypothetical protein FSB75_06570 [Flavisolibacter ginsenosidimutans]
MKKVTALTLLLSLFALLFSSCASEYFHTPNDLYRMKGTVYLRDGTQKQGALTVLFENGIQANPFSISLVPAGSETAEYLKFTDVAAYVINGETYVPKRINLNTAGINHDLFVKRLSDGKAKIQLYELQQKRKSSDTGEETSFYFIGVPAYSATELIELHSALLVPGFEEKMSAFVADCPALSAKIKNKEGGYVYSYLSSEYKKLEVMKRIIDEYTSCQSKPGN